MLTDKQLEDRITVFESCRRDFERTIREELSAATDRADRLRRVLVANGIPLEAPAPPVRLTIVQPQPTLASSIILAFNDLGGSASLDEVMQYLREKTRWRMPNRSSVREHIYTFIRNGVINSAAYKRKKTARAA